MKKRNKKEMISRILNIALALVLISTMFISAYREAEQELGSQDSVSTADQSGEIHQWLKGDRAHREGMTITAFIQG